jgi:hypothetical protein
VKEYEQLTVQYFTSEIYNALDIGRKGVEKPKRITTILPLVDHLLEMRKMDIGESRKKRYELLGKRLKEFILTTYRTSDVRNTEKIDGSSFFIFIFLFERI